MNETFSWLVPMIYNIVPSRLGNDPKVVGTVSISSEKYLMMSSTWLRSKPLLQNLDNENFVNIRSNVVVSIPDCFPSREL